MPGKPKPTALKVLQGNPGRRPLPKGEPVALSPLGPPPAEWPAARKLIWNEIAGQIPPGLATRSDRLLLELAARLVGQMRDDSMKLAPHVTPALAAQIRLCLGALGMTPADRARLAAPKVADQDDAARFFGED